jgi:hypothetical protein
MRRFEAIFGPVPRHDEIADRDPPMSCTIPMHGREISRIDPTARLAV